MEYSRHAMHLVVDTGESDRSVWIRQDDPSDDTPCSTANIEVPIDQIDTLIQWLTEAKASLLK